MKLTRLLMYVSLVWIFTSIVFIVGCDINSSKEWGSVTNKIQSKYPTVSQLSTEEVHNLLARQDPVKPILLDIREPEEYAVSHLPGAYLATTDQEALRIIAKSDKDSLIIVYCSVGYRSSEMAKKLQEKGFTKVFNLEGSIFKWANEGRELYQGDQQTNVVHPFNSKWKQLLDKTLWSKPME
jgi:rhodanese-related sulfurtransferase